VHVEHVAREDEASAPLNPCQPDRGVPASFSLARSLGRSAFDRGSMCHRGVGHAGRNVRIGVKTGNRIRPYPGKVLIAVRVVVADDDLLLREGLARLLEQSGFDVVGQAGDGGELLALVRERVPALVVADIRMWPTHSTEGLDAARVIREEFPGTAILLLAAHVEIEHAIELLSTGRNISYLLKSRVTDVADFMDTLERVAKGALVVDPALVSELVSPRRRDDPLGALSAREREVLALMAEGRSNAGIAHQLRLTAGTVEKHVHTILKKLALPATSNDHRRVLAVITFLEAH